MTMFMMLPPKIVTLESGMAYLGLNPITRMKIGTRMPVHSRSQPASCVYCIGSSEIDTLGQNPSIEIGTQNARTAAADTAARRDHEPQGREEQAPKVLRVQGPKGVVPAVLALLLLLGLLRLRGARLGRLVLGQDGVAQLCGGVRVGKDDSGKRQSVATDFGSSMHWLDESNRQV